MRTSNILRKISAFALSVLMAASAMTAASFGDGVPGIVAPNDADYGVMAIGDADIPAERELYVKAGGAETNKGTSPEDALPSLQAAIDILGIEGGTIVIVGEISLGDAGLAWPATKADGQKRIIIAGYDDNATLVWNMTWAYQQDYAPGMAGYERFAAFNNSQETMYNAIVDTTKSVILVHPEIDGVLATGTGIQNARTSFLGDTLTRDGYHLNFFTGRYTAGLTYFGAIVGAEYLDRVTFAPVDVQFHGGIIEDEAPISMDSKTQAACIEAAKNAIANPFEVTQSTYAAK